MIQTKNFFSHLVIALSKHKVGNLTSYNHVVWMLDGVSVIPFARSDFHLRPEQREAAIEQRKMVEDCFNTPYFYFSYTLDLSNSQQKLDGLIENDAKGYFVLGTASESFTWNCELNYLCLFSLTIFQLVHDVLLHN